MTIRIATPGRGAPGLAGLLAVSWLLALGASPAHAQLPEVPGPLNPEDPPPEAPESPEAPEAPEGTDLIGDLLGEGLLDPGDVLELGELLELTPDDILDLQLDELLDMLDLDDLLGLLDLLGENAAPDPDPTPVSNPAAAPDSAVPQVTEVPRGGVATGAGGTSDTGASGAAPLVLVSLLVSGGGQFAARRWVTPS